MTLAVSNLIDAQITLPASLSLTEESKATRSILLADSDFKSIATREDANAAGASARDIRTHIKAVREMGMSLRRPLKAAIMDRIKAIEDEYCGPLEQRQGQLESLVTAYAKAEAQRVAEEERKRQEEVRRIASRTKLAADRHSARPSKSALRTRGPRS
jgi:hypothetical protein